MHRSHVQISTDLSDSLTHNVNNVHMFLTVGKIKSNILMRPHYETVPSLKRRGGCSIFINTEYRNLRKWNVIFYPKSSTFASGMLFLTQNLVPSQVVCLGYETFASGMLPFEVMQILIPSFPLIDRWQKKNDMLFYCVNNTPRSNWVI